MTTFVMKGYKGETVGFAISNTPVNMSGCFHIQGRQPIGEDGAPQWVFNLFENNPDIEQIGIRTKTGGYVYSR